MPKLRSHSWHGFLSLLTLLALCSGLSPVAQATDLDRSPYGNVLANNDILDLVNPALGTARAAALSQSLAAKLPNAPKTARNNLIKNFWVGKAVTGHIAPTWNGYRTYQGYELSACPATVCTPGTFPDPRGGIWEAGTLYNVFYTNYKATQLPDDRNRLRSHWNHIKQSFTHIKWNYTHKRLQLHIPF